MEPPEAVAGAAVVVSTPDVDPLSVPPWIKLEGLSNLRDTGGYRIASKPGYVTKKGVLYRSAAPQHLSEPTTKALKDDLHVTTVFDLRSKTELKSFGDAMPVMDVPGIERVFAPVFEDQDLSPQALAARWNAYTSGHLVVAYKAILATGAENSFPTVLRHILNHPDSGTLIHCTAGKDRTGVLTSLLLSLAGVSDEDISKEYSLTTMAMVAFRKQIDESMGSTEMYKSVEGLGKKEGVENLLSSKYETMMEFLKVLREEEGGVEKYLREKCGLSEEEVTKLRNAIVVKEE